TGTRAGNLTADRARRAARAAAQREEGRGAARADADRLRGEDADPAGVLRQPAPRERAQGRVRLGPAASRLSLARMVAEPHRSFERAVRVAAVRRRLRLLGSQDAQLGAFAFAYQERLGSGQVTRRRFHPAVEAQELRAEQVRSRELVRVL